MQKTIISQEKNVNIPQLQTELRTNSQKT